MEIEETFDLDSDHSAVILTLSERIIKKEARPMLVNKTTDWKIFRIDLQKEINLNINFKTTAKLDIEAENFTRLLQTTTFNNTKEITHITKGINYPVDIRNLVREDVYKRQFRD